MEDQTDNKRRMYNAFSQGLDSFEIVAYHGTSLQALKRVIKTGRQVNDNCTYRQGDIFVYPISARAKLPFEREICDEAEVLEGAKSYAENTARDHYLAEVLGIDLSVPTQVRGIFEGNIEDLRTSLHKITGKSYGWNEAVRLYEKIKQKRGIVLGYSQRIFERGEPMPDPEEGMEMSVRVLHVDIESIIGIEPLDQESYDFLTSLES